MVMNYFLYQRLTLYETPFRFYLVGSDSSCSKFNVLKIERSEPKKLILSEDSYEYTRQELDDLLSVIKNLVPKKSGNKSENNTLNASECRGLLGFVRFLEGYYMILVTKARRICKIGYHWICKIEETSMIYIPNETPKSGLSAEEQRYLRTFQAVDLSTNFYFSYTYDLSRTLASNILHSNVAKNSGHESRDQNLGGYEAKYLWNNYLREPLDEDKISKCWILPVIHGFIAGCSLNLNSSTLTLVLIARRSCKFAGTRFLKRGANFNGSVANEVEIEQIVFDPTLLSFESGRFTSFVQCRGSVPLIWSQDLTKVVGKPRIEIDLEDPFAIIPALHFRDLLATYGSPVIVINLVKRREKRQHESVLNDEFKSAISYLNQFLDPKDAILYLSFDMARCLKGDGNVLANLEEIGSNVIKSTGFFQTFPPLFRHEIRKSAGVKNLNGINHLLKSNSTVEKSTDEVQNKDFKQFSANNDDKKSTPIVQNGVARVNCVDCLDRTNVAQLVIGKVALAHQLYALGTIEEPQLRWDSEAFRAFEALFEEQGDTLALQYAGSQLVHSVRTYKKTSVFQERSRDVIQTLSRYYSNTFADYDKQNALNLFLGVYRPSQCKSSLWELANDFWLHNSKGAALIGDYCHWFKLPDDYWLQKHVTYDVDRHLGLKMSDYDAFYKTYEMTSFDLLFNSQTKIANNNFDDNNSNTSHVTSGTNHVISNDHLTMKLGNPLQTATNKLFWKRSKLTRGKFTQNDVDEDDDDDQDSSEEDARSDIDVMYSSSWNERSQSLNNQDLSSQGHFPPSQVQQQTLNRQLQMGAPNLQHKKSISRKKSTFSVCSTSLSMISTSFSLSQRRNTVPSINNAYSEQFLSKKIYGFEIRDRFNKRDLLKYEQFAQMARRPSYLDDETNNSDQRSLDGKSTIDDHSEIDLREYHYQLNDDMSKSLALSAYLSSDHPGSVTNTTIDRFRRLQYQQPSNAECFMGPASLYTSDSSFAVDPPEVTEKALQKYAAAIHCAHFGPKPPSQADYQRYVDYLCCKQVAPA